ncbi:MAG TPA: SRPBCC domain-containing protein [Steroidobacteraceae bacterium]|nr:SRPBCC domain-containing protein [Steroidobacteraceae bacterium]
MSGAYRSFAHRVDIAAPVERVWRAFTDSGVLERWTSRGASVTPREKGRMHVLFGPGIELDGHIDVLVTPQRMRLILLPTPGMPGTEAVIVEDFLFERYAPVGTAVRLLSSGVPAAQAWVTYYLQKRRHWELALARLKVFLEKGLDERSPEPRY